MLSEINSLVLRAELCVAVRSNDEGLVGIQQSGIALRQINALTQFESFPFFEDLKGKHR